MRVIMAIVAIVVLLAGIIAIVVAVNNKTFYKKSCSKGK